MEAASPCWVFVVSCCGRIPFCDKARWRNWPNHPMPESRLEGLSAAKPLLGQCGQDRLHHLFLVLLHMIHLVKILVVCESAGSGHA